VSEDTTTTEDEKPHKKGKGAPKEAYNPAATPVINDEHLYEFLLALFYDDPEPEQFPEHVDLNIVSGKYSSKIEQTIWSKKFAPIRAEEYAVKHGAGAAKPNREQLAALSNLLLAKMRRDCDESGHARAYAVMAWSTSRSDSPYMSFPKKMAPAGRFARKPGEAEDEDEGLTRGEKFVIQLYTQQQKMFELYGEMLAGLSDRYQRTEERDASEIEKLRKERHSLTEQLERALSLEQDREERRAAFRQKREIIDKGMNVLETYGPSLASSLIGGGKKDIINGSAETSDEAEALRNFLRTTDEGGSLTQKQMIDAFGDWDENTGRLTTPGVLAPEQVLIVVMVSKGQTPPDELDKLMPGGPLEITQPQLMQLVRVFGAQIEQLKKIFDMRMQKRQSKEK
jgi:hypothetical protein